MDGSVSPLSDSVYACVLDYDLDADCAYGVAFTDSEATTSAGVYGPVGVHTRTGHAETGPVVDSNDVLDIVQVLAAPLTLLDLSITQDETDEDNAALESVGDTINYLFEFTFDSSLGNSDGEEDPFYVL